MEQLLLGREGLSLFFMLLLGMLLFAFFRLFGYLTQLSKLPSKQRELFGRYLPATELVAWIAFLIWITQSLYYQGNIVTFVPVVALIIILISLGWFLFRDLIAGVIFNSHKHFRVNDQITVSGVSGKIVSLGLHCIEIEDTHGHVTAIPYSMVTGTIITRAYASQNLLSHTFHLKIKPETGTDSVQIIKSIRDTILTLPWSSQRKEPRITIDTQTESLISVSITVFSVNEIYLKKIESHMEEKFRKYAK